MTDTIMSQEERNVEEEEPIIPEEVQATDASSEGGNGVLMKQLSEMQALADKYKNEHLRAVADLDNMRRRMVREREELLRTASAGIVEGLFPVMDNMILGIEAAERHKNDGTEEVVKGFKMVLDQMRQVLNENGVKVIDPKGESFDPNLHESVALMPSDDIEENKVQKVVRVGYSLNDRLLRPASVVVSSGSKTE